jgi:hypothetical protein
MLQALTKSGKYRGKGTQMTEEVELWPCSRISMVYLSLQDGTEDVQEDTKCVLAYRLYNLRNSIAIRTMETVYQMRWLYGTIKTALFKVMLKQSHYSPGQVLWVPGV